MSLPTAHVFHSDLRRQQREQAAAEEAHGESQRVVESIQQRCDLVSSWITRSKESSSDAASPGERVTVESCNAELNAAADELASRAPLLPPREVQRLAAEVERLRAAARQSLTEAAKPKAKFAFKRSSRPAASPASRPAAAGRDGEEGSVAEQQQRQPAAGDAGRGSAGSLGGAVAEAPREAAPAAASEPREGVGRGEGPQEEEAEAGGRQADARAEWQSVQRWLREGGPAPLHAGGPPPLAAATGPPSSSTASQGQGQGQGQGVVLQFRRNESIAVSSHPEAFPCDEGAEGSPSAITGAPLGAAPLTVTLLGLSHCRVLLPGVWRAVFLRHVEQCTVLLGAVAGAVHVEAMRGGSLAVACHQLRCHEAEGCRLQVAVRSPVLLEGCRGLRMAPYDWAFCGCLRALAEAGLLPRAQAQAGGAAGGGTSGAAGREQREGEGPQAEAGAALDLPSLLFGPRSWEEGRGAATGRGGGASSGSWRTDSASGGGEARPEPSLEASVSATPRPSHTNDVPKLTWREVSDFSWLQGGPSPNWEEDWRGGGAGGEGAEADKEAGAADAGKDEDLQDTRA